MSCVETPKDAAPVPINVFRGHEEEAETLACPAGATLFFYYRNQRLRRAQRQAELLKEAEAAAPAPAPTASIASTPTLFETSPSSSFRNADDEMSICPSEDVPSEEATPTQPTQPQPSQSARAWDRLYFARALRVSPPAGRRSPSSAEH